MLLTKISAKLYAAGAAIMAVLGVMLRMQYLKNKNERLTHKAEVLESRVRQDRIIKEREREVAKEFRSRETDLIKELERKDDEDFKGIDNLNNPNDW
jgi:hypothetical protein